MSLGQTTGMFRQLFVQHRLWLWVITMFALPGLAACSTMPVQPNPPAESEVSIQAGSEPTASTEIQNGTTVDWLQVAGKEGDLYVLGNPDAPIRLVDYSDFL